MDAKEKKKFIKDLCNRVRDEMLSKVGDMPEFWDGLELRLLLAQKFESQVYEISLSRRRNFRNEVIVRNL